MIGCVHALKPERPIALDVTRGDARPRLLAHIEETGADLDVAGARERHGLARWHGLGSVSRKLVLRVPSAILNRARVVPEPPGD